MSFRDFPGSAVVKTPPSNARGAGSIPGWRAQIPHASGLKIQNIKQKQYCNKFNKDFKNGPLKKNSLNKKVSFSVQVFFFFFYCHCLSSHSTCSFHEPWGAARWATGASLVPASPKLPFSIWSLINCASAAAPGANFYLPFHCCVLSMQRLFIYHLMLQHPAGFVVAAFHLQRH